MKKFIKALQLAMEENRNVYIDATIRVGNEDKPDLLFKITNSVIDGAQTDLIIDGSGIMFCQKNAITVPAVIAKPAPKVEDPKPQVVSETIAKTENEIPNMEPVVAETIETERETTEEKIRKLSRQFSWKISDAAKIIEVDASLLYQMLRDKKLSVDFSFGDKRVRSESLIQYLENRGKSLNKRKKHFTKGQMRTRILEKANELRLLVQNFPIINIQKLAMTLEINKQTLIKWLKSKGIESQYRANNRYPLTYTKEAVITFIQKWVPDFMVLG